MPIKKRVAGSVEGIREIGVEYIKECLRYCPDTGDLYWKYRPAEHFANPKQFTGFNTRFAEKRAGAVDAAGYVIIRVSTKDKAAVFRAHHVVLAMHGIELDSSLVVDHRDTDRSNNRIENLRQCTEQQNSMNRVRYKSNKSRCAGVFKTAAGTWSAFITHDSLKYHLGTHKEYKDAVEARISKEKELKGEFFQQYDVDLERPAVFYSKRNKRTEWVTRDSHLLSHEYTF